MIIPFTRTVVVNAAESLISVFRTHNGEEVTISADDATSAAEVDYSDAVDYAQAKNGRLCFSTRTGNTAGTTGTFRRVTAILCGSIKAVSTRASHAAIRNMTIYWNKLIELKQKARRETITAAIASRAVAFFDRGISLPL